MCTRTPRTATKPPTDVVQPHGCCPKAAASAAASASLKEADRPTIPGYDSWKEEATRPVIPGCDIFDENAIDYSEDNNMEVDDEDPAKAGIPTATGIVQAHDCEMQAVADQEENEAAVANAVGRKGEEDEDTGARGCPRRGSCCRLLDARPLATSHEVTDNRGKAAGYEKYSLVLRRS